MPEYIWELPPETAADEAESVESTEIGVIDHAEAAVRRLVVQFQKPKMQALVRALCASMQPLEVALVDLCQRTIDNAEGVQIEIFGRLVGQSVVDVEEASLKSLIRARIPANRSSGLGKQVLTVARLVVKEWAADENVVAEGTLKLHLVRFYPAGYVLYVEDADMPFELANLLAVQFLRKITGAGIRAILQFVTWISGDGYDSHERAFQMGDSDGNENAEGGGWGHVSIANWKIRRITGGAAWDAGASSVETAAGDCYVETTVVATNTARAFGLSYVDTDQDFATIDYCWRLNADGTLGIYELGVLKASPGAYVAGDLLRIYRIAGTVEYKVGGATVYVSLTPSVGAVKLDTSIFTAGASLEQLSLNNYPPAIVPITAWNDDVFVETLPQGGSISDDYGGKLAAAIE